jgi:hypothetical protein
MTQQTSFIALQGHEFMNLITFRKTGVAVTTPVWFVEEGGKLYVMTGKDAGKVKRIRANGRAHVGPSDRTGKSLGPVVEAQARILSPDEANYADALLTKKYGIQKRMFDLAGKLRGGMAARTYLEIAPIENRD